MCLIFCCFSIDDDIEKKDKIKIKSIANKGREKYWSVNKKKAKIYLWMITPREKIVCQLKNNNNENNKVVVEHFIIPNMKSITWKSKDI